MNVVQTVGTVVAVLAEPNLIVALALTVTEQLVLALKTVWKPPSSKVPAVTVKALELTPSKVMAAPDLTVTPEALTVNLWSEVATLLNVGVPEALVTWKVEVLLVKVVVLTRVKSVPVVPVRLTTSEPVAVKPMAQAVV